MYKFQKRIWQTPYLGSIPESLTFGLQIFVVFVLEKCRRMVEYM